jgi:hypothetical protein
MSTSQYISLKDAAALTERSQQTIRRFIKGNKIKYRKYKTPQGFTYLVEKSSLLALFQGENELDEAELVEDFEPELDEQDGSTPVYEAPVAAPEVYFRAQPQPQPQPRPHPQPVPPPPPPPSTNGNLPGAGSGFQTIINELIRQHREDKNRLFELLETFQKRILILEDHIHQLEAPKGTPKRWYKFWK